MDPIGDAERMFRMGRGNWDAFDLPFDTVLEAAEVWRHALAGVEKPWLCWNVEPDWSYVQQRLIAGAGWTPVVGFDPRVGPPKTISNSVIVDFNDALQLPVLYPHFVLEFVFLFTDRLAFWHSDLLLTEPDMAGFAASFDRLDDGEMAAVRSRSRWRRWLPYGEDRYWELLGCTTRGASQSQFDQGCGWWMHFNRHPNAPRPGPGRHHWEYGNGIRHWQRSCGGIVQEISQDQVCYGHFTRIGKQDYRASEKNNVYRNLNKDLQSNFDIRQCVQSLDLSHLLPAS
ncbi:MAG: hypothetical protein ACR2P3_06025 [Geminicoccaceae bacterium]